MSMIDLKKYKKKFEKILENYFNSIDDDTDLKKGCYYSLSNGGKRIRPILVFLIAEALQNDFDVSFSALAVEFFHTASLIADDLPCMDNEDSRRCKAALHKAYSEDVALLCSYTLISMGYQMITENADVLIKSKKIDAARANFLSYLALKHLSKVSGINGATKGQYLDLKSNDRSIEMVNKIMELKTAVLFELAFILGWLFGGGDEKYIDTIKKASYHFGMAFQIADDILDMEEDQKENKINFAVEMGKEKAVERLDIELDNYSIYLLKLPIKSKKLLSLSKSLKNYVKK